jgi:hypothetical protein
MKITVAPVKCLRYRLRAAFFALSARKLSGPILILSLLLLSLFAAESNLETGPVYSMVESAVVADPGPLHDTAISSNKIVVSFNVKVFFIGNRGTFF